MEFTIETRELTSGTTRRSLAAGQLPIRIEAPNADDAVQRYVRSNSSQLMSLVHPGRSGESIATVRKDDSIFLLRVYSG